MIEHEELELKTRVINAATWQPRPVQAETKDGDHVRVIGARRRRGELQVKTMGEAWVVAVRVWV